MDRLVATPAAFLFNLMARIIGSVMRRDHSTTQENVHRIIVAKLVGMGSAIEATPLLKSLKAFFPQARITFVTLKSNKALVERLPGVDDVVCMDDRNPITMALTTLGAIVSLVRLRADLYFDLEVYSGFASLLALWAVTRNRIGFYRYSTRFKNGIYTHLVFFNTRMHVSRLYLQLGRVVGVPRFEDISMGPIRLDPADRAAVDAVLSDQPSIAAGARYIVVNPNASDLLLERRWPAAYVVEAVEKLSEQYPIVFIGSRSELPYVQSLCDRLCPSARQRVVNSAGRLKIGELLLLLNGAACVLTNDTGPMHMSFALGRPTVCLFGPVSPEHYGQDLKNVTILYAPVFCSPCVHEIERPACNGDNVCMQRLMPDLVIDAVRQLIAELSVDGRSVRGRTIRLPTSTDTLHGGPLGLVVRASMRPGTDRKSARA